MPKNKDLKANPLLAVKIAGFIEDFKTYAATNPSLLDLDVEQRLLEAKIHDAEREANMPAKTKSGLMFDRIVNNRGLERKLKDKTTPLEFLYETFNNEDVHIEFRLKAATSALAYVHRKLPNQVEHTGKDGGALQVEHTDARDKLTAILFEGAIEDAEFVVVEEDQANDNHK